MSHEIVRTYPASAAMRAGIHCWDNIRCESITDPTARVVIVREWFRDCDMAERTSLYAYPATDAHIEAARDSMEANAEGPWSLVVIALEDVADVEVGSRDLAMEAFENGHGANAFNVTSEGSR